MGCGRSQKRNDVPHVTQLLDGGDDFIDDVVDFGFSGESTKAESQ